MNDLIREMQEWAIQPDADIPEIPVVPPEERDIDIGGCCFKSMGFLIVKNPTSTLMEEQKRRVPGIIGSNILGHMSKSIVPGRCLDVMDPKEWQRWKHVLALYEEAQVAKRGDGTWPVVVRAAGPGPHLIPARTAIRVEGTCCLAAEEITVMISNSSYTLPALPRA